MALKILDSSGLKYLLSKIKNLLSGKADKSTTLSGYGITDAYTKTETDNAINSAKYTLPTASNSTLGGVKTTSTVTSTSGLTASPIIDGVPYYKNTTYSNASLGSGYGTCATASATLAKVVTLSSYSLSTGGVVAVKFTYAVPANSTMNINSKGAKSIYYNGKAIVDGVICAGEVGVFIYDGTRYHLLTVDRTRVTPTLVPYGKQITPTEANPVDLNNVEFLKVGNYFCSKTADVSNYMSNVPEKSAFMMEVSSPLSTTIDDEAGTKWKYRLRKFTTYQGNIYYQYCAVADTADVWTFNPWYKVYNSKDTVAKATQAQKDWSGNVITSTYATKTELGTKANSADLAKVATTGKYSDLSEKATLSSLGLTATATELNYCDGVTSNIQTQLGNKYNNSGGAISGHIYLTGAKESSSTSNTSQLVFGTSSDNHLALSSNRNALVINPTTASTSNQIVLYLDKASVFPSGIQGNLTGTASKATADANGKNIASTYATKSEVGEKLPTTGGTFNGTGTVSGNITGSRYDTEVGKGVAFRANSENSNIFTELELIPGGATVGYGDMDSESPTASTKVSGVSATSAGLMHVSFNSEIFLVTCATEDDGTTNMHYNLVADPVNEMLVIGNNGLMEGAYITLMGSGAPLTNLGYLTTKVNGNTCSALGEITIPEATTAKSGVMSSADKTKLNSTPSFTYSTSDISVGSSLSNGTVYVVYE